MSDMSVIEDLVDSYVGCWRKNRPEYVGIFEDNDFGCEHLQVFRNGYNIEDFSYEELCELAVLLTRSLRGQINRDHKMFWSWCSFMTQFFQEQVQLFKDADWVEAFGSMVDLLLAEERPLSIIPGYTGVATEHQKYVNNHLISVCFKKHILAGPQSFAVLDGLLRRKAHSYVAIDGIVQKFFSIMEQGGTKTLSNGTRMERINDGLRLFNQLVTRDRDRPCFALRSLEGEILNLYPGAPNGYDLIEKWRTDLIHSRGYWQNVTPIVVNIICLLVIDEIEPHVYDEALPDIKRIVDQNRRTREETDAVSSWGVFPPDLIL